MESLPKNNEKNKRLNPLNRECLYNKVNLPSNSMSYSHLFRYFWFSCGKAISPYFFSISDMKYLIVTGGVLSGLGKGITISSLGRLLQAHGVKVTSIKIDPYLVGSLASRMTV